MKLLGLSCPYKRMRWFSVIDLMYNRKWARVPYSIIRLVTSHWQNKHQLITWDVPQPTIFGCRQKGNLQLWAQGGRNAASEHKRARCILVTDSNHYSVSNKLFGCESFKYSVIENLIFRVLLKNKISHVKVSHQLSLTCHKIIPCAASQTSLLFISDVLLSSPTIPPFSPFQ